MLNNLQLIVPCHLFGRWLPVVVSLFVLLSYDESRQAVDEVALIPVSVAAMPHSFTGYSLFLAHEKGFLRDEGLDVTIQNFSSGRQTLNALADRRSDFAVSSETPFIHAVLAGQDLVALATTIHARRHLAVVARSDSGVASVSDLVGKRLGVTMGSNGEYFLDVMLARNRLSADDIELVHTAPGAMLEGLQSGTLDAVATWNPQMTKARQQFADNAQAFGLDDLYAPYFMLLSRRDYVEENPEAVIRVLRALLRASRFIQEHPAQASSIVAKNLKADVETLAQLSAFYEFRLSLHQALLTMLEHQAEWIIRKNPQHTALSVNFLERIHSEPLRRIAPHNVSLIK